MLASGKDTDPERKKIATFLWLAGRNATEICSTLFPNDGTADGMVGNNAPAVAPENENEPPANQVVRTLKVVIDVFEKYCILRKNITMESFKFINIVQQEKQTFADFEMELRKQIQYCEFKCECGQSYENRMLVDRIIIGVNDKKLQLKLLDTKNEKLSDVVDK